MTASGQIEECKVLAKHWEYSRKYYSKLLFGNLIYVHKEQWKLRIALL